VAAPRRWSAKSSTPALIAHNLIRCTMAQAAAEHRVPLERISFKGSLDALRHFTQAMARARSKPNVGASGICC